MLVLPIKRKWFDMILSGEKKEEYREIKPYYDSRFKDFIANLGNYKIFPLKGGMGFLYTEPITVIFRNGYSKNSPSIKCKVRIKKGPGLPEWGAEPGKVYYVLEILKVEEKGGLDE